MPPSFTRRPSGYFHPRYCIISPFGLVLLQASLYHQHLKLRTMKNLVFKFGILLLAILFTQTYSYAIAKKSHPISNKQVEERIDVDLVSLGAISSGKLIKQASASEIMRDVCIKKVSYISDSTHTMAIPAAHAGSDLPDYTQKLTFSAISSILLYFFTFLVLFSTRFLRDDEFKNDDQFKTLSLLRVCIFTLFYFAIISVPVSIALHGHVAKASASLFLISAMAGIVLLFHVFLKKANLRHKERSSNPLVQLVDKAFPMLTLVAGFLICLPAWTQVQFAELPVEFVIFYMIIGMVHVGRKTLHSSFVHSTFIRQVFNH